MDGASFNSLEAELTTLWGQISAATCEFLLLLARYDRERGWEQHGLANCAQWLNWQCGIGPVAAREKLRVAHALDALPKTRAEFARGRLSYSKVRAMTRVARPENEQDLINIARHGTAAHIERLVRRYRRAQRIEAAKEAFAQHRERSVSHWFDDDGSFVLHARLPAEVGALIKKALDLASKDVSAETFAARSADALTRIAEQYLEAAGTDEEDRRRSASDRYQVVIHVEQDGLAEIEDGPPIAEETARRISCDTGVVVMTHDSKGNPLNVGRRTRAISPAMRRALYVRDRGCRFPGCTHTRHTEGHHVRHWANGGETKLSNLVTLCSFHHRLIHEGGFAVRHTDDGVFVFTDRKGRRIPDCGQIEGTLHGFRGNKLSRMGKIDADAIRSRWCGEPLDYGVAIEGLLHVSNAANLGRLAVD